MKQEEDRPQQIEQQRGGNQSCQRSLRRKPFSGEGDSEMADEHIGFR